MRRDPHHATRHRGGATDGRGLLVDGHRGAVGGGGQGSRESGASAAEHNDVDFMVPRRHSVLPSCSGQLRIADNSLAALTTASLPRITTSSRCEIRLMQVGGDGGSRWTATAKP